MSKFHLVSSSTGQLVNQLVGTLNRVNMRSVLISLTSLSLRLTSCQTHYNVITSLSLSLSLSLSAPKTDVPSKKPLINIVSTQLHLRVIRRFNVRRIKHTQYRRLIHTVAAGAI